MISTIPYEETVNRIASPEYLRKRNEEIYLKVFREISGNPDITFEDELAWYKEQGKPITNYSRTVAIRKFCQCCNDQENDSGHITCGMKWGKPSENSQMPNGCAFNVWAKGIRYIPAKSKKVTQTSAIKLVCMWCQGADSIVAVKYCSNFLYKDKNGDIQGCWLFPFRMGKNPFNTRVVSEEVLKKAQEGLARWREDQKKNK
jgi:hypothetical protein